MERTVCMFVTGLLLLTAFALPVQAAQGTTVEEFFIRQADTEGKPVIHVYMKYLFGPRITSSNPHRLGFRVIRGDGTIVFAGTSPISVRNKAVADAKIRIEQRPLEMVLGTNKRVQSVELKLQVTLEVQNVLSGKLVWRPHHTVKKSFRWPLGSNQLIANNLFNEIRGFHTKAVIYQKKHDVGSTARKAEIARRVARLKNGSRFAAQIQASRSLSVLKKANALERQWKKSSKIFTNIAANLPE